MIEGLPAVCVLFSLCALRRRPIRPTTFPNGFGRYTWSLCNALVAINSRHTLVLGPKRVIPGTTRIDLPGRALAASISRLYWQRRHQYYDILGCISMVVVTQAHHCKILALSTCNAILSLPLRYRQAVGSHQQTKRKKLQDSSLSKFVLSISPPESYFVGFPPSNMACFLFPGWT